MSLAAEERELGQVCSSSGIPPQIAEGYRRLNISDLYEWQLDCIRTTNVLHGNNLVYCAPTSGGKTLVAELALLKQSTNSRRKTIFILPFVSLIVEKEKHLKKILRDYNANLSRQDHIRVKGYYGEKSKFHFKEQILLCTIEKANIILNRLIEADMKSGRLSNKSSSIGCVVIDEMHMMGDSFRGYLLEIFVRYEPPYSIPYLLTDAYSKINYLREQYLLSSEHRPIQVVALSATMENVEDMAKWLHADFYRTDFRPVPLREYVCIGSTLYSSERQAVSSVDSDKDPVVSLCLEGLGAGQQVIVFCGTKRACEELCLALTELVRYLPSGLCHKAGGDGEDRGMAERLRLSERLMAEESDKPSLKTCVTAGAAFHHSDLSESGRTLIEKAFKEGVLSVLFATSTLATGVNLPAGRVIVHGLSIGKDTLSVVTFRQMCGRAGRAGQAALGEAFLIVGERDRERAFALMAAPYPPVLSQISPRTDGGRGMLKALLEVHSLGICGTASQVNRFLEATLWFFSSSVGGREEVRESARKCLMFLIQARLIQTSPPSDSDNSNFTTSITRFGLAAIEGGLNPDEVMVYYEDLYLAHQGLNLQTNLHLLYLITSIDHNIPPDFRTMW